MTASGLRFTVNDLVTFAMVPSRCLYLEARSWNQRFEILSQKEPQEIRLILPPGPDKGQRLQPRPESAKSKGCRLTSKTQPVAALVSHEFDQHSPHPGFDQVSQSRRLLLEDEPSMPA